MLKLYYHLAIGEVNKKSLQPEDQAEAFVHPGPCGQHHLHEGEVGGQPEEAERAKGSRPLVQPAPVVEKVTTNGDEACCDGNCWL